MFVQEVIQTAPPPPLGQINPTGRDIPLGGPLKDGAFILGEVSYTLTADDRILIDVAPLLELLQPVVSPAAWQGLASALAGRQQVSTADLGGLGYPVDYDPGTFGLNLSVNPDVRPRTALSIAGGRQAFQGPVAAPANISAYVTAFLATDYVHVGEDAGFDSPSMLIDEDLHGRCTPETLPGLLKDYR